MHSDHPLLVSRKDTTLNAKRWIIAIVSGIILLMTIAFAAEQTRPKPAVVLTPDPVFQEWEEAKAGFVHEYELRHGAITSDVEAWLFSNAHRMCWFLKAEPRLPSEAFDYGVTDLKMSSDQTVSIIELGMKYVDGCPQYRGGR